MLLEKREEEEEEERSFKTCNFGKVFRPLFTLIPDTRCESFHRRHRTCPASWSIAELFVNTQSAEKQSMPTTPMRFNSSSYVLLPPPSPTIYSPLWRLLLQRPPPSSFPCEDFSFFFFFFFSFFFIIINHHLLLPSFVKPSSSSSCTTIFFPCLLFETRFLWYFYVLENLVAKCAS